MSGPSRVLDASALLALVNAERGADEVAAYVAEAAISSVNWCEVYGKLRAVGIDGDTLAGEIGQTGIVIVPFDDSDARAAGELLLSTRDAGLSLADRACLAFAQRLGVPAVTADRSWVRLDIGVDVTCVR